MTHLWFPFSFAGLGTWVVNVIDEVLDDSGGIRCLDIFAVMGDESGRASTDDDGALFTLLRVNKSSRQYAMLSSCFMRLLPSMGSHTFLPYRLRASALIAKNFSPPIENPLAKASSGFVKATTRELMSSCESYRTINHPC